MVRSTVLLHRPAPPLRSAQPGGTPVTTNSVFMRSLKAVWSFETASTTCSTWESVGFFWGKKHGRCCDFLGIENTTWLGWKNARVKIRPFEVIVNFDLKFSIESESFRITIIVIVCHSTWLQCWHDEWHVNDQNHPNGYIASGGVGPARFKPWIGVIVIGVLHQSWWSSCNCWIFHVFQKFFAHKMTKTKTKNNRRPDSHGFWFQTRQMPLVFFNQSHIRRQLHVHHGSVGDLQQRPAAVSFGCVDGTKRPMVYRYTNGIAMVWNILKPFLVAVWDDPLNSSAGLQKQIPHLPVSGQQSPLILRGASANNQLL